MLWSWFLFTVIEILTRADREGLENEWDWGTWREIPEELIKELCWLETEKMRGQTGWGVLTYWKHAFCVSAAPNLRVPGSDWPLHRVWNSSARHCPACKRRARLPQLCKQQVAVAPLQPGPAVPVFRLPCVPGPVLQFELTWWKQSSIWINPAGSGLHAYSQRISSWMAKIMKTA